MGAEAGGRGGDAANRMSKRQLESICDGRNESCSSTVVLCSMLTSMLPYVPYLRTASKPPGRTIKWSPSRCRFTA